ncbi:hypothetical protein ROJ8625_03497 [Roseivivax jejudonensis]|uniref:Clp protease n=1 Tax=Roseivivax jejudonensis TaxID=1529041 RepID=A0A1X7A3T4_9RHOB|nr:hypothetical protein [Roseivivax jejudonensis]SLN67911.1 hypothetical protein ROJ8625_03497 [Roseivivax jejudonensis]
MSTAPAVGRTLKAVLAVQIGLGLLLVLGDIGARPGGFSLPGFGPDAPSLTEPVRPGDQRRVYDPSRPTPSTRPARTPGDLPERLTLTRIDGARYRLEGGIQPGDADRVATRLTEVSPAPDTLVLQSPGGSVTDALRLGRTLRERGIGTEVLAGEVCFSACPYLLVGGTTRTVEADGAVGVHQHYFGESTILPARFAVEDIQRGQAEVMTYLSDMGIDPMMMTHALATPPDEIYVLLPEELERYGIVDAES